MPAATACGSVAAHQPQAGGAAPDPHAVAGAHVSPLGAPGTVRRHMHTCSLHIQACQQAPHAALQLLILKWRMGRHCRAACHSCCAWLMSRPWRAAATPSACTHTSSQATSQHWTPCHALLAAGREALLHAAHEHCAATVLRPGMGRVRYAQKWTALCAHDITPSRSTCTTGAGAGFTQPAHDIPSRPPECVSCTGSAAHGCGTGASVERRLVGQRGNGSSVCCPSRPTNPATAQRTPRQQLRTALP